MAPEETGFFHVDVIPDGASTWILIVDPRCREPISFCADISIDEIEYAKKGYLHSAKGSEKLISKLSGKLFSAHIVEKLMEANGVFFSFSGGLEHIPLLNVVCQENSCLAELLNCSVLPSSLLIQRLPNKPVKINSPLIRILSGGQDNSGGPESIATQFLAESRKLFSADAQPTMPDSMERSRTSLFVFAHGKKSVHCGEISLEKQAGRSWITGEQFARQCESIPFVFLGVCHAAHSQASPGQGMHWALFERKVQAVVAGLKTVTYQQTLQFSKTIIHQMHKGKSVGSAFAKALENEGRITGSPLKSDFCLCGDYRIRLENHQTDQ